MSQTPLSLDEIYELAKKTLLANGCDEETSNILSELIMKAERDGSLSHGLFRLPAYVEGLKSGKINGKTRPEIKKILQSGGHEEIKLQTQRGCLPDLIPIELTSEVILKNDIIN